MLTFRPVAHADLDLVRVMHNDPSTLLQLGDPTPVTTAGQEAWFERMQRPGADKTFLVCLQSSGEPVGVWRLQTADRINRVCEVGVDIFPQYRRQGLGLAAYRMLLAHVFGTLEMAMVYLRVGAFNEAGLQLYRQVGFTETGRLVSSMERHGRRWDTIFMCITREEYDARRTGGA